MALGKPAALSVTVFAAIKWGSHVSPPCLTGALQDLRYDSYMRGMLETIAHHANVSDYQIPDLSFLLSGLAFLEAR